MIVACALFGVFPAVAQGFPDTPQNHWAYDAVAQLHKDGILVGYPDGLFRGIRPASRYEMAVAINAAYQHLHSIVGGLQQQFVVLRDSTQGSADVQALNDSLTQLRDELEQMKGWGSDIEALKSLAAEFEKELTSLGLDVEQMKVDLGDLSKRVGALEEHRLPIDIHGNADLFMIGGASIDHKPGVTTSGRPVGVRIPYSSGAFDMAGLDVDSTIYHELDIKLASNKESGPKWHSDVAISNLFGSSPSGAAFRNTGAAFAGMSTTGPALLPFSSGAETVYVSDLALDFDSSLWSHGLSAELGRTGYSIDSYMFQRPNPDPYYKNDLWEDGKWYFDGGVLGLHLGSGQLNVFGGKQDQPSTTAGGSFDVMPMTVGFVGHPYTPGTGAMRPVGLVSNSPGNGLVNGGGGLAGMPINESLGLNLKLPITGSGKLDLAYLWFESNNGVAANGGVPAPAAGGGSNAIANRADVYGGDLHWNFSDLSIAGGYSASDLRLGNTNVTPRDNFAWHVQLSYDADRWGISGGYRDIEPQYGAPGDWGRIGLWWNPTDIRGPMANAHFDLTKDLKLSAAGEWYNGPGDSFASPAIGVNSPAQGLSTHDRIDHYTAELGWRLSDSLRLSLGTELVYWHLPEASLGQSDPIETWYNLGLGLSLPQQAWLSFFYQMSNYDSRGNPDFQVFNPAFTGPRYTGSLLTTQLSVKF